MWTLERRMSLMKEEKDPFELEVVSVRLVKEAAVYAEQPVTSPPEVIALLGEYMCEFDREVVCVVNLRNDGIPLNCHFASMGAVDLALAHPRELFKASILSNASGMLLIHNHPSGRLAPSKADVRLTDQMVNLCELMGIPLYDHIIVGGKNNNYFSFKEKELLSAPNITLQDDYRKIEFTPTIATEKGRAR